MKTRLMSNEERTSFRLDVINKGELNQCYFTNLEEAINYQNNLIEFSSK